MRNVSTSAILFPYLGNRRRHVPHENYELVESTRRKSKATRMRGRKEREGRDETKRRGNTIRGKHDGEWWMVNQKVGSRVFFLWENQEFLCVQPSPRLPSLFLYLSIPAMNFVLDPLKALTSCRFPFLFYPGQLLRLFNFFAFL